MGMTADANRILSASRARGWVIEPDAKRILAEAGLTVPRFRVASTRQDALRAAAEIGYPLVAKIISPSALHKSDVGGVVVGIASDQQMAEIFDRFSVFEQFQGVHLEEMVTGLELIVGAKIDPQFGPVILLGIGGTSVEVYQDTVIRMAPLEIRDVAAMVSGLKAKQLLDGYRGRPPVCLEALTRTMTGFSALVMDLADWIESIDLNPVMCTDKACIVADARIMLK